MTGGQPAKSRLSARITAQTRRYLPDSEAAAPEPLALFIWQSAGRGVRYALWFVLLGAVMGGLYVLLGGYVVGPALFVVVFCGVLAALNAAVALGVLLLQLVFGLFGHGVRVRMQYVVTSGSFVAVYGLFFGPLRASGLHVF